MNWKNIVYILQKNVPLGAITTYAHLSRWAYGVPNRNQPIGSLLRGAYNNGFKHLTNRVVRVDGSLAHLPGGNEQQKRQLIEEGIPFDSDGKIDMKKAKVIDEF